MNTDNVTQEDVDFMWSEFRPYMSKAILQHGRSEKTAVAAFNRRKDNQLKGKQHRAWLKSCGMLEIIELD